MRITKVRIVPVEEGNQVAYADITIDESLVIRDLKIFRRPRGYLVAMPQIRQEDGKYREVAFAINARTRKMIEEAVIAEYRKAVGK